MGDGARLSIELVIDLLELEVYSMGSKIQPMGLKIYQLVLEAQPNVPKEVSHLARALAMTPTLLL